MDSSVDEDLRKSMVLHAEKAAIYEQQSVINEATRKRLIAENESFKNAVDNKIPYFNTINSPSLISANDYAVFSLSGILKKESFEISQLPEFAPQKLRDEFNKRLDASCCDDKKALITKISFSSDFSGHIGISESRSGFVKGANTFGCEIFLDESDGIIKKNVPLQYNHKTHSWHHRIYWAINKGKTVWLFSPFIVPNKFKEGSPTPLSIGMV